MKSRSLRAFVDTVEVGTLSEQGAVWQFEYSQGWLNNPKGFDLSPALPRVQIAIKDGSSKRPVQWFFDNLLPEEGARQLLAKDAKVDGADAFALLQHYGAESAGSLTLLPQATKPDTPGVLKPLPFDALQARIKKLPNIPLAHGATKKMSLAGAQHKLAVVLQAGELFEPVGETPSTHILKPNHVDAEYPHSVINEWFTMRLAKRVGLDVPDVHRLYVPAPVYLVNRFDRLQKGGKVQRRHAIDACQLLGIDRVFKYSQGSVDVLMKLAGQCRSPAVARTRLFSWLVFNVLVGNSDAHLKNISFLVSSGGVQLAPFYDLLSIGVYDSPAFDKNRWPDLTELAWPIKGASRFAQATHATLTQAGETLGLSANTTTRILQTMRQQLLDQAHSIYKEVEQENQTLMATRPELVATFAGELRCLRAIIHSVIQPMCKPS